MCSFQILKPVEKKQKYSYGGMQAGRPVTLFAREEEGRDCDRARDACDDDGRRCVEIAVVNEMCTCGLVSGCETGREDMCQLVVC
eukprot:EC713595.1.p3 GENE.EC713595.1~~EC713595.1.p3  ORF type:complete len:85 (+),score=9.85 EC713595.1:3-257(+)